MLRRFVATAGRTLMAIGVLLLLFVAYQLWGTGFAEARGQDRASTQFAGELASLGLRPLALDADGRPVTTTTIAATTTGTTLPAPTTTTGSTDAVDTTDTSTPGVVDGSTVVEPGATTTVVRPLPTVRPGRSQMQRPEPGKVVGRFVIPSIRLDKILVEGAGVEDLKTGPGHYPSTPFPGQPGNAGIACHRTTYGAPCFRLDLVSEGDDVYVQTLQGSFHYVVERSWVVSPKDTTVLAPTPGENVLTITTCHPAYTARQRYVVRARLVGDAAPSDFFVDPEPVEPALATTTTVETSATVPDMEATTTLVPPTTVAPKPVAAADASSPRWRLWWLSGPRSTWLATLGWAAVCAVVWLLAWRLARGRRLPGQAVIYVVGFVLLFGPSLFLCYEHLARLLPENI